MRLVLLMYMLLHADSILTDINECELGINICVNAECNNTAGSYTCRPCFPGFIPGNLTTCSEFYDLLNREICLLLTVVHFISLI